MPVGDGGRCQLPTLVRLRHDKPSHPPGFTLVNGGLVVGLAPRDDGDAFVKFNKSLDAGRFDIVPDLRKTGDARL